MSNRYSGSLRWYTLASDLLTYVNAHMTTRFERVSIVPGLIAWDGCDCGAIYLMVNQTFDCEDFPMQKVVNDLSMGCGAPYEASELVLQVMECAPTPQGNSNSTSVEAEDAAARLVRMDAYEARKYVREFLCTQRNNEEITDFIIDGQIVQGPSGGCVGTELRFRVGLDMEV
jgi:hypothetical protein